MTKVIILLLIRIMMPFIIFFSILLFYVKKAKATEETRVKIAVIDTGRSGNDDYNTKLCLDGHKDFTGTNIIDTNGHGSNVLSIISEGVDISKQCIIVIKVFDNRVMFNNKLSNAGISYAKSIKAQYVNMSFGGTDYDVTEHHLINGLLKQGAVVAVAAGNNGLNLNYKRNCNYYPACLPIKHKNYKVVAALKNNRLWENSNYGGPVNTLENGVDVIGGGYMMSGTSQATAVAMSKIVREDSNKDKSKKFNGSVEK